MAFGITAGAVISEQRAQRKQQDKLSVSSVVRNGNSYAIKIL
jgi:hypothetical protein